MEDDLDEDEDDEDEDEEVEEVDEVELGPLPLLLLAPSDEEEFVKGRNPPLFVFTSPTVGTPRPMQACTSAAVTYSPRLLR